MKNSVMYALTVVILDIIAAYSVINAGIDPSVEEYNNAIAAAEKYESQELYYKSAESYNEALKINESYELRMKIADLYEKGYENGEISSLKDKYNMLNTVISLYPENTESYDIMISYLESQGNYSSCSDYVRAARSNGIHSDIVDGCYDTIKKIYTEKETSYISVEDFGDFAAASRNIISEYDTTDESEGLASGKTEREMTEYTYMYYNNAEALIFTTLNMSPPAYVSFSDGSTHMLLFNKGYGKDINSGEMSDIIYSRLESDGIRQCYIGEENEYTAFYPFNNQRLVLFNTKTGKYDMFGTSGKKLAEGYDMLGGFANNVAYSEKEGKKSIINSAGEPLFTKNISEVILGHGGKCSYYNRMFIKFENDAAFKMINTEDLSETGFECDDADLFSGGAAAFKKNGKYGFVNTDGSVFIEPSYEDAKSFSNGYAAVKFGGKWGFINKYGDIVIEPAYEDALYMDSEGSAFVYLDGTWRIVSLFYIE